MQNFVIFHPENKENNVQVKVVNAYMNRLCIDEADQNEVLEIFEWKPVNAETFERICFLSNLHSNWAFGLGNFANKTILKNQLSLEETIGLIYIFIEWKQCELLNYGEIRQLHILVALPMMDYMGHLFFLFTVISLAFDFAILVKDKYRTARTIRSDFNFTVLLSGREIVISKQYPVGAYTKPDELTICDDIESLTYQIKTFSLEQNCQKKNSSVYAIDDDTFVRIKCLRINYAYKVEQFLIDIFTFSKESFGVKAFIKLYKFIFNAYISRCKEYDCHISIPIIVIPIFKVISVILQIWLTLRMSRFYIFIWISLFPPCCVPYNLVVSDGGPENSAILLAFKIVGLVIFPIMPILLTYILYECLFIDLHNMMVMIDY